MTNVIDDQIMIKNNSKLYHGKILQMSASDSITRDKENYSGKKSFYSLCEIKIAKIKIF